MKILVADHQDRVRFALRMLLERMLGLKVMGEASNSGELSLLITSTCPDLLLLEWELPNLNAEAMLPDLRELCPNLKVIVISGVSGVRQAALQAGADEFVNKTAPPEALLEAVNACRHSTADQHADFFSG